MQYALSLLYFDTLFIPILKIPFKKVTCIHVHTCSNNSSEMIVEFLRSLKTFKKLKWEEMWYLMIVLCIDLHVRISETWNLERWINVMGFIKCVHYTFHQIFQCGVKTFLTVQKNNPLMATKILCLIITAWNIYTYTTNKWITLCFKHDIYFLMDTVS